MNIYLSGAHRTGKTTVAERLAEKINHKYIATKLSTMDMWAHVGSPSAYYTYAERIELQDALFTFLDNVITTQSTGYNVFDRGIIDLVGYLNTNYDSTSSALFDNAHGEFLSKVRTHYSHADRLSMTFILQPHNHYKYCLEDLNKINKTYNSYEYRQAITDSIVGFAARNLQPWQYKVVPVGLDIDQVVDFIFNYINKLE